MVLFSSFVGAADWQPVNLRAPLTTVITAPAALPPEASSLEVELAVPADAADDLGAGLWVQERHGGWFQHNHGRLRPGETTIIRAPLSGDAVWTAESGDATWSAWRRSVAVRWGVFVWSTRPGGSVRVRWHSPGAAVEPPKVRALVDLAMPSQARTGIRWELAFRPAPYPWQPFDPQVFAADLVVTRPDGVVERRPCFHDQPIALEDRGDVERGRPAGPARFLARWRPRVPGLHRLELVWTTAGGGEQHHSLPSVDVVGQPWDDYVRVDTSDARFFARNGGKDLWWPVGLNLQSITDPRTRETYADLPLRPTPDRGTRSYDAYLARLAAAGGDAAEIWLCSWNLALEWSSRWYGYYGIGRYNEFNAARLDVVLDQAWSHGIRLVLNCNNHGQVLPGSIENEWDGNPYNRVNGGPLSDPDAIFTDPEAIRWQSALRRYLAGRLADHPAVLTWKLWSEVDLTSLGIASIRSNRRSEGIGLIQRWHEQAAADWKRLDTYAHPVSTHFATTYQNAHPAIAGATGIDIILLDAYYAPGVYTRAENLSGLMVDSTKALAGLRRPVFATEFGGGHEDRLLHKLDVEHSAGAFLALVTGHAGAPMLWWREWVDQGNRWQPYQAISNFIAGEDLRGGDARSIPLNATAPAASLWCRAWARPGRVLFYLQDRAWSVRYQPGASITEAQVIIGDDVKAGAMTVAWWDADLGKIIREDDINHTGGRLSLACPTFAGHLAGKLHRR